MCYFRLISFRIPYRVPILNTQWGCDKAPPKNFELSVLRLTRDPARAAAWLDRLPIKLPPGPSLTGAEQVPAPVAAQPYPANVAYTREAPHAPFTYGCGCDRAERERVRSRVLGALNGGR